MSLEIWGSWLEWKMKFCGFEQSFAAFVPAWGALGWKFNLAAPLLSTPVTCECELQAYSGIYTAWPPKKSHTHISLCNFATFISHSHWGYGLDSVVANPCVKMMSHAPWTTLSQFEPDESWHFSLGICPCHQGRKLHWWKKKKKLLIQYIQEII